MIQTASQIALCLMLLITTAWCIVVYRKLVTMKSDAGPISELIHSLNQAAKRADQTILAMRLVIKDADERLAAFAEIEQGRRQGHGPEGAGRRDSGRRLAVLEEATRRARQSAHEQPEVVNGAGPATANIGIGEGLIKSKTDASPLRKPRTDMPASTRRYEDSLPARSRGQPANAAPLASSADLDKLAQSIASLR